MPPRPSSVQSDGSLHPAMSQSPMAQDRGMRCNLCLKTACVFAEVSVWTQAPFTVSFQGSCRETLRCPPTVLLSQHLHYLHASPQGGRCILGWVHISRATPWVAMDNREDNTAPKVCCSNLFLLSLLEKRALERFREMGSSCYLLKKCVLFLKVFLLCHVSYV